MKRKFTNFLGFFSSFGFYYFIFKFGFLCDFFVIFLWWISLARHLYPFFLSRHSRTNTLNRSQIWRRNRTRFRMSEQIPWGITKADSGQAKRTCSPSPWRGRPNEPHRGRPSFSRTVLDRISPRNGQFGICFFWTRQLGLTFNWRSFFFELWFFGIWNFQFLDPDSDSVFILNCLKKILNHQLIQF